MIMVNDLFGKRKGHNWRNFMLDSYRTVYAGGQGELTEKNPDLLQLVRPVKTEEEALAL